MTPTRDDVLEAIEQGARYEISARGLETATDAVMRLLDQTEPLARGVVDHYDSAGCLAVEVGVQDIGIGTHVVIYEDKP